MKNLVMAAAILEGMNSHNRLVDESRKVGEVKLTDYCGNVFTLYVWVTPQAKLHYLLSCRNTPHATSNMFRSELPSDPAQYASDSDLLAAVAATRNVAKTATYAQ